MRTTAPCLALALLVGGCAHTSAMNADSSALGKDLARTLIARHEWSRAFAVLGRLAQDDPRDPDVLELRGRVYEAEGLAADAESAFRQALALQPDDAAIHSALAVLLDETGRHRAAEAEHRQAAKLDPGNPRYLNNLGFSLFAAGRTREAIQVLLRALRQNPTDPRIRDNLGFAYARLRNWTAAEAEFERAGTPAAASNDLGVCRELVGDDARARGEYLRAAQLDPLDPHARRNLERLVLKGDAVPSPTDHSTRSTLREKP